jgi:hypothetical protein
MSAVGVPNACTSTADEINSSFLDQVVPDKDVGILSRLVAASQHHVPVLAETLFVPVFRKDGFVLGEMYGSVTLNAMAVAMVSDGHKIPTQIARRFVIDLNAADGFEFVEYEWFLGGFLVIAVHTIALNGRYKGHSTVFAPDHSVGEPATRSKVIMRFGFEDVRVCQLCNMRMPCICPLSLPSSLSFAERADSFSWTHWTSVLEHLRTGSSLTDGSFSVSASIGDLQVTRSCLVSREFTQRDGISGRANILRRKYASAIFMQSSHPTVDEQLVDSYIQDQLIDTSDPALDDNPAIASTYSSPGGSQAEKITEVEGSVNKQTVESGKPSDIACRAAHESPGRHRGHHDCMQEDGGILEKRSDKKVYNCSCGFMFSHRGHFNAHQRAVHMKYVRNIFLLSVSVWYPQKPENDQSLVCFRLERVSLSWEIARLTAG